MPGKVKVQMVLEEQRPLTTAHVLLLSSTREPLPPFSLGEEVDEKAEDLSFNSMKENNRKKRHYFGTKWICVKGFLI